MTAISHSPSKEAQAKELGHGATWFINTSAEDWSVPHKRSLDVVISTIFAIDQPTNHYLAQLTIGGTLVFYGIPEDLLPSMSWTSLRLGNNSVKGSGMGSKTEVLEMLRLVKIKKIKSRVEVIKISKASEVVKKMGRGEVVLKN